MSEVLGESKKRRTVPGRVKALLSCALAGATWYVMNPGLVEAYTEHVLGRDTAQEQMISDAASKVYGKQILVHCSNKTGPLFVRESSRAYGNTPMIPIIDQSLGVVVLQPWLCDSLSQFADNPRSKLSTGLHALSHELSHVMGKDGDTPETREDVADCYATQRVAEVAEAFGASPADALAVAQVGALVQNSVFEGYNATDGCFDDEQYDLDPNNSGVFPPQS